MAHPTTTGTSAPDRSLDEALLAVELELMRAPSFARMNGARRQEMCRGILEALDARGVLTGIPSLAPEPVLRAA